MNTEQPSPLPPIPSASELLGLLKQITDQYPGRYACVTIDVSSYKGVGVKFRFRAYQETLGHSPEVETSALEAVALLLSNSRTQLEERRKELQEKLSATEAMLAAQPATANPLPF